MAFDFPPLSNFLFCWQKGTSKSFCLVAVTGCPSNENLTKCRAFGTDIVNIFIYYFRAFVIPYLAPSSGYGYEFGKWVEVFILPFLSVWFCFFLSGSALFEFFPFFRLFIIKLSKLLKHSHANIQINLKRAAVRIVPLVLQDNNFSLTYNTIK